MEYNKNDFETWGEAARWMQKHGYGIEQIRIEEENWKAKTVLAAEPVKVVSATNSTTEAKSATKTAPSTTTKTK